MRTLTFLLALVTGVPALGCDGLIVSDAWIREAPPGAGAMAGYAILHNRSERAMTVDGARSAAFGAVELHRTDTADGNMRMRQIPRLFLDPGATAALEPGEVHIMLFGPKRSLKAGDRVELTFDCGTRSLAVNFDVRADN
jgi:periplasmic copper chaperone A